MNVIQYVMARYARKLLDLQQQRPLDDDELWLLKNTEPTLRRAEAQEAEREAAKITRDRDRDRKSVV